jgi:mercuric ion transport protein
MAPDKFVWTGATGSVAAALCCFTPVLTLLLGAMGLSAWLGWLDYVFLPALALFLGLAAYGLYRRQRRGSEACGARGSAKAGRS